MAKLKQKAQKHQTASIKEESKSAPEEYNEYGVHLWVLVHGF
jgi:hypothetical protein